MRHSLKAGLTASVAFSTTLFLTGGASAQINVGGINPLFYSQNFDTLTNSGAVAWQDNASSDTTNGLRGWYAKKGTAGNVFSLTTNDGSNNAGNIYSFGTGAATDRALGSIASGSANNTNRPQIFGVRFVNTGQELIDSFTLSYTGEQWRDASTSNHTLSFSYAIFNGGAGTIGNDTQTGDTSTYAPDPNYIPVSQLNFDSIKETGGLDALDGNAPENRSSISFTVSNISLNPNQELWLRFVDLDQPAGDHALAIDQFSVNLTAVPEPSTVALLGAGVLPLYSAIRRRIQKTA